MADIDTTSENITKPLSDKAALAWLRAQSKITVSGAELARQWGWNECKAQRKLDDWKSDGLIKRRGKQITVVGTAVSVKPDMTALVKSDMKSDTPAIVPTEPGILPVAHIDARQAPAHHGGSYVAAGILALAAVALGGIQLAIDAQYAGSFGRTPIETALQGMQGVAIGVVTMILPCVASVLHRTGQIGLSWCAWAIWSGFLVLTILAGMGFSAGGLSDAIAGRAGAIEQAVRAKEQRAQAISTAQRAADTVTEARKAECTPIRGPRCRDREADERTALAALNTAIAVPLPPAVAVSAADPGAEAVAANISWASFGLLKATSADVQRTWITGRAVMPAFAGLLLSMAVMAWPRPRW
jgi:hypothetical protein